MPTEGLPTELSLLGWSTILLFVHMLFQGATAIREQGLRWNAGPRDDPKPLGTVAGRARRAFDNFKETYPIFVALALALAVSGRVGGIGAAGALLWLVCRIVYLPLYLFGVPWLRTIAWAGATIGMLLMLIRLFWLS